MVDQNAVYHSTFDIAEGLLYRNPSLHIPLRALNIISAEGGRSISAVQHPELDGIIDNFYPERKNGLRMITVVGNISVTAVIPLDADGVRPRLHHVWYIIGELSLLEQHSWSLISSELCNYINFVEFMPEPFCRKVVYLESWNEKEVKGMAFSEVGKNLWTIGDPMRLPLQQTLKTTANEIIGNILADVKEVTV